MKLYRYSLIREGLVLENEGKWGEIAPLPSFSTESLDDAFSEVVRLWPNLSQASLPSVRFGWECAQRPFRSVHIPLAALNTPRLGFTTLKLKLGHLCVSEAVAQVQAHKQWRLRLDFNRKWTFDQIIAFASHFKPTDFEYLEEPLSSFEELVTFSHQTSFPIALDESFNWDWSAIPSLTTIVVKPTIVGSVPSVPPHLKLVLSSAYETGIGLLHIAQLGSSDYPIGLDTVQSDDLLTHPIDCSNGYFSWQSNENPIDRSKLCPIAL